MPTPTPSRSNRSRSSSKAGLAIWTPRSQRNRIRFRLPHRPWRVERIMNSPDRWDEVVPLPSIPTCYLSGRPVSGAGLRHFGTMQSDLEIDLTSANVPALITRILEQCTVDDAEFEMPGD